MQNSDEWEDVDACDPATDTLETRRTVQTALKIHELKSRIQALEKETDETERGARPLIYPLVCSFPFSSTENATLQRKLAAKESAWSSRFKNLYRYLELHMQDQMSYFVKRLREKAPAPLMGQQVTLVAIGS